MINNYNEYLEQIKKKLDDLNKAAGIDPKERAIHSTKNHGMPSNDIFDMLGNGAKKWMDRNKEIE
jgi:hypothetical protein